jgi:septal ring factor EnvC (AmiA/AmiB activator)
VYPELVIRDDSGKIQGVRYEELAPMLLNELQQEKRQLAAQNAKIGEQSEKLRDLTQQVAELNDVKQELRAALRALQSKELVAQR